MAISYQLNQPISSDQFIALLAASTLAERQPVDDLDCIQGILDHSNLMVSAWDGDRLVGIARSVTDFHYACTLSDLAVDQRYQKAGIGRQLQAITQRQLGPRCKLILIAAPAADDYYRHLGSSNHPRCWVHDREPALPVLPAEQPG